MKSSLPAILILLSLLSIPCSSENLPFRSRKSPRETIHSYDVVHPEVESHQEDKIHPHTMKINIKSNGKGYKLNLKLNELLLPTHFTSLYYDEENRLVSQGHPNCFYQGTVEGHSKWKAVFSTCQGLRGFFGDLENKELLFHLEPLHETFELTDPHVLYSDTEHQHTDQFTCGTPHNTTSHKNKIPTDFNVKYRLKRQSGSSSNIVELLVVNDYYQFLEYNRNISAVVLRAISIINHVDMLYQSLNVRVIIVSSETWTSRQQIDYEENSDTLLALFRMYHSNHLPYRDIVHDSTMMITGIDLVGNTVGIAYLGVMCSYDQSVGVTQDTRSSVESVATILAHELGHNFGLEHDDASSCNCPDSNSGCIMNAVSRFPPATNWSQCSRNELTTGFTANDLNRCLGNSPTTIVGEPKCGNGIKEPNEICDCGTVEECTDPCCNATTCTLNSGAQCSSGKCCENCQFKLYGTACRNSRSECDLLEYCTGSSADCPQDVTRQNGLSCDGDAGYCYDGICSSHELQCRRYYGNSSTQSNLLCYSNLNTQGQGYGHCGSDGSNFIRCSTQNILCGSLHCDGGSIIYSNVNTRNSYTIYTRYVNNFECRSFTTSATVDEVSPGLVMDGSKCGNGSFCVAQRCVSISSVVNVPCPVGSNGRTCSGNGVCNNLDKCSCNIGFTGSDCSLRSEISNPSGVDSDTPSSVISSSSSHSSSLVIVPITSTATQVTVATSSHTYIASSITSFTTTTTSSHTSSVASFTSTVSVATSSHTHITSSVYVIPISTTQKSSQVMTSSINTASATPTSEQSTPISTDTNLWGEFLSLFTGPDGGVIGGLVVLFLALAIIAVVSVVIVIVVIVKKKGSRKANVSASSSRTRYTRGSVSTDQKITFHGSSHDDLLTERANSSSPGLQQALSTYVPPTYKPHESDSPAVTVNNNRPFDRPPPYSDNNSRRPPPPVVNRAPPPPPNRPSPSTASKTPPYNPPPVNKPSPRPPPPVNKPSPRPPPPVNKPSPPVNRPPPPVNKPSPPVKPSAPPKPQTAPKPGKVQVQWPPPSSDAPPQTSIRPNKPMVPPRK